MLHFLGEVFPEMPGLVIPLPVKCCQFLEAVIYVIDCVLVFFLHLVFNRFNPFVLLPTSLTDARPKTLIEVVIDLGIHETRKLARMQRLKCIKFCGPDAECILELVLSPLALLYRGAGQLVLNALVGGEGERDKLQVHIETELRDGELNLSGGTQLGRP